MLKPNLRAADRVSFMITASSPTREVAEWHQCSFHMSTTIKACNASNYNLEIKV
jgi:hypothetical protein